MADAATDDSGGIDINQIMEAFTGVNQKIDASVNDLTSTVADSQKAFQSEQSGINNAADAQVNINIVEAAAASKELADNRTADAFFGTNPNAPSFALSSYADKIAGEEADLDARSAAIRKKEETGFFDDPLGFIGNQFSLPSDIAAYNTKLADTQRHNAALTELTTHTLEAAKVNSIVDAADATQKLDSINKLAFAKAGIAVAQSQQKMEQLGISAISVRNNLNKEQFDTLLQVNTLQNQKLQYDLAVKASDRADKTLELQEEYKRFQIGTKEEQQAATASIQKRLNTVTTALGMPSVSAGEFKTMSGPLKNAYESFIQGADIDNGRLGYNAADILGKVNAVNAPLTPDMNIIRKRLTGLANGAAVAYNKANPGQEFGKLPVGAQNLQVQTAIEADTRKEASNVTDENNIYSPAPLSSVLKIPTIASLSLAKDLAPIAASQNLVPTRAQDIYTTALQQVADGKLSPEDAAAQVSTIYKAINLDNTARYKYNRFALPAPTSYNTTIFTGMSWSNSQTIDMTNAAQLQSVFTRASITRLKSDAQTKGILQGFQSPIGAQ